MDAVRKALGKVFGESKSSSSPPLDLNGGAGQNPQLSAASATTHSSLVLTTRPPRLGVSYWECSKFCAIFFVAGAALGYALKGCGRRWASKVLKRLTDN